MKITRWFLVSILLGPSAWAQSGSLVGEWESVQRTDSTDVVSRLWLDAGGTARVDLDGQFGAAFLAGSGDEDTQQLAELFPDGLRIQITAHGTWEADGDSLLLSFPEPELLINGGTFQDFIITIATALAQTVIDQLAIPPAQEPAVIATFVDLLAEDLSPEDVTNEAFADDDGLTAYRIEDNVLFLTDAEGVESRWKRRTSSLVAPTGWGDLKREMSPVWPKTGQTRP